MEFSRWLTTSGHSANFQITYLEESIKLVKCFIDSFFLSAVPVCYYFHLSLLWWIKISIVLPHQLEDNAQVAAKQEIIGHADDVEFVVAVESAQRV